MENVQIKVHGLDFEHIGWKYYNTIRKKAMEQEFSWSGLVVSLSIAFFIVILAAYLLSVIYSSFNLNQVQSQLIHKKLYRLETTQSYSLDNYLQTEFLGENRFQNLKPLTLVWFFSCFISGNVKS